LKTFLNFFPNFLILPKNNLMTTVKTIPKNIDQNAQGKAQEADTLYEAKILASNSR
jgi:hypothetical protein